MDTQKPVPSPVSFEEFSPILSDCFEKNGISSLLSEQKARKLYLLYIALIENNAKFNLTSVTDVDGVVCLHFADSCKIAKYIPEGVNLLDVGCGGGFPCLPLSIVRPDLRITALDATAKKITYVNGFSRENGLNLTGISDRAELSGQKPSMRERFGAVTARAVSRANVLTELCLPFLRIGGQMIMMKGPDGPQELNEAESAVRQLGGKVREAVPYTLFGIGTRPDSERFIGVIDKVRACPDRYPRAYAQILKKPL